MLFQRGVLIIKRPYRITWTSST